MQFQQSSEVSSEASSEAIAQGIPRKLIANDGVSTLNSMNRSMTHGTGPAGRQAAARLLQALKKEKPPVPCEAERAFDVKEYRFRVSQPR
jgi:hypothetical protein